MPYFCRSLVSQALNHVRQRSLSGSKILVLGVAYKPDIADTRIAGDQAHRAPAKRRRRRLVSRPARALFAENGVALSLVTARAVGYDCVVVVTNHAGIDYDALVDEPCWSSTCATRPARTAAASDKVWKL